ncbi:DUF6221 family protein [Streptomyces sp. JV180]|uniref:DUF6221 family protein n=1 Tax=Streptomyces sp. JV180 TaxID=858634 RepID=UPI00168A8FF0|nr:DUF6221 family protein [Streptomyces sp. JV180]MBD3549863.1 hypothetical protein [Streptomyces sp. JV180]
MTADLTAFLRARLDEDAATPEGALEWHSPGSRVVMAEGFNEYEAYDQSLKVLLERDHSLMPFGCVAVTDYDADAKYIALHDPARTLREVEAKRGLLDAALSDRHHVSADQYETCPCATATDGLAAYTLAALEELNEERRQEDGVEPQCWESCGRDARVRRTLHLLALPYADHPDFLPEWRP